MADRIVVMNGSIVEQVGALLDLYDRPAYLFVAGFIVLPVMNLIEGKVERYNNEVVFRTNRGLLLLPRSVSQAQEGKPAIFGIRPEHMQQPKGRRTAEVSPVLSVVEPTGSDTQVITEIEGHQITAALRGRVSYRPGDVLPLMIDQSKIHLFDQETGNAIVL